MVQPSNVADVVQEFIAHLALEPEKKFFLGQNDPGESFALPSVLNVILNNRVASLETLDFAFRRLCYLILLFVIVVALPDGHL